MMVLKRYFKVVATAVFILMFTACGGGSSSSDKKEGPVEVTQQDFQTSTYIYKGNFVEVASHAYKRVTDESFTRSDMIVSLPGDETSELITPSLYNIRAISTENGLRKIIVQNHLNTLEVKMVDKENVNILLKSQSFTVDRKMPLDDLVAVLSEEG